MGNQCHYMSKNDGRIEKVNLNDWVRKRRDGFVFRTEAEYAAQQAGATPDRDDDVDVVPTMDNTKAEITAYLESHGYDVDQNDTKAEMLAAFEG